MRCTKCQEQIEQIIPEIKMQDWLKLSNYFEHELTEGEITDKTWESMTDALSSLRPG
jgi:hypothetical protein